MTPECMKISQTYSHFENIAIDLMPSVNDGIKSFFHPEVVGNYKCTICDKLSNAVKSFRVHKAPSTLIVHIKRFHIPLFFEYISHHPISFMFSILYSTGLKKINFHCRFDNEFNKKQGFIEVPLNLATQGMQLQLRGGILHEGPNLHDGHYTAFSVCSRNNITLFNDSMVRVYFFVFWKIIQIIQFSPN